MLTGDKHPSGSLITLPNDPKVYLVENGTRRHILSGYAFVSYGYDWDKIKPGTTLDAQMPVGAPLDVRQGSLSLSDGNIYVIDYDNTGIIKRPVGPWECFANQLHYDSNDLFIIPTSGLPPRTGSLFTC